MSFNYSKEKFLLDKEWKKLRVEYAKSGMTQQAIQDLYDFDLSWFRMRRNYENHVQALPEEIDEQNTETHSNLFQKFASLSMSLDEMAFSGRYAWVDTISDVDLVDKLKSLSEDDLELLTLFAIEGYTQREIAKKMCCSQKAISKKSVKIKKFFKKF